MDATTQPQKPVSSSLTVEEYQEICREALLLVVKEWNASNNDAPMPPQWQGMGGGGKVSGDISDITFKELRQYLKDLLTAHMFEPSEKLHELVEKILRYENSKVTVVGVENIQNINFVPEIPGVHIGIWQGDICKLKIGAIVNAANCYMLGCTTPNHPCIDNIIHDRSGTRLRLACRNMMRDQGSLEKTGVAKITPAYCLPSDYVIHTVGPIYRREGTARAKVLLEQAYVSCLEICVEHNVRSIAFCCISTGVFGYPQEPAVHVAMQTVKSWLSKDENYKKFDSIVFNVFKDEDLVFYQEQRQNYFGSPKPASVEEEQKPAQEDEPQQTEEKN